MSNAGVAEAVCRDYVQAQGPAVALFEGFLYGYVAAEMKGRSDEEMNAAVLRLAGLVGEHCARQPDERLLATVEQLAPLAVRHVSP